jgi:hypothetical protein
MDAAKKEDDLDTVHFPPLVSGERVKCSYADQHSMLTVGTVYTIKINTGKQGKIDQIGLLEVPDGTFPETLFDRLPS